MYFNYRNKLIQQTNKLVFKYKLIGIKAEFEAESSSFDDVFNLRAITNSCNTKLFVKIGGAEALNDIYNCLHIGVDGIIAPMIESKFAVYKFVDFFRKKKLKKIPHLSINIETKTAYKNLNEILEYTDGYIKNITIGRSDLSKSFFRKNVYPDSDFINNIIINIAKKVKKYKMTLTVGGSLSSNTISKFRTSKKLLKLVDKMETRKVILPISNFMYDAAIEEALKFENYYILFKNELHLLRSEQDKNRLSTILTRK